MREGGVGTHHLVRETEFFEDHYDLPWVGSAMGFWGGEENTRQ